MGGEVMSSRKLYHDWDRKAFVSLGVSVKSARWSGGDSSETSVRREFEISFAVPIEEPSGGFSESSKVDANHFGTCVGGSLADMLWNAIEREMPCPEKAMMSARSAFFDRVDEICDQLEIVDKAERMELDENGDDA
jgi:hypothetical protein